MFDSVFETVNAGFAQALYEDYLRDPSSVPPSWRAVFDNGLSGEQPIEPPLSSPGGEVGAAPRTAEPDSEDKEAAGPGTYEPLKGPALRLLQNMEASLAVPTATSFRDVRVSYLWDVRKRFNALLDPRGVKLSFTHLVGWAIVLATERFPSMVRAVVEREGRPHQYDPGAVNLGLAVDVERKDGRRSLVVPVIKQVNSMTFGAFHEEYERLVAGARTNKLLPDSYQGATITLTIVTAIGPSLHRRIGVYGFTFRDDRWRLVMVSMDPGWSPEVPLTGDCAGCYDHWERWEGTP